MVYLDHAALTPTVAAARDAMSRALHDSWGNPLSVHAAGRRARTALDRARVEVADYIGCTAPELRWTASGSQALRLALAFVLDRTDGPVVSSRLEHPSLRERVEAAETGGRQVRWLPLARGNIDPSRATTVLQDAAVVALSAMNHELGTAAPLADLIELAPRAWWVVDAVQAAAWLDLSALFRPRVLMAIASHKLGGPPGVGALRLPHQLAFGRGDDDPFPMPAGTPPWLAAVGMGAACCHRKPHRAEGLARVRALAEDLHRGMRRLYPKLMHNADDSWAGPIVNVSLPGMRASVLENALDMRDVCIARTSACQQSSVVASPVVAAAWPQQPWRAENATRWSLSPQTTKSEIETALAALAEVAATHAKTA